jgi:phage terminase large subunit-like protein
MSQTDTKGWQYAERVVSGDIPAAKPLLYACTRAIEDRKNYTGKDSKFYYDPDAANRCIKFFGFLRHLKGPLANQPLELADWQIFIVSQLYGWMRTSDGYRRYRTAYVEVPRKSGKSTFCSGLTLYGLIADRESAAEVYAAATTRDQARIVHGDAQQMVKKSPQLLQHLKVHRSAILHDASGSKFEPLSSDAGSLEGRNPSFSVVDELHVHKTDEIWNVLNVASGARAQPIIFAITTAGTNREGICYELREYCMKVIDPNLDVQDDTFFAAIWTIDAEDDWKDPAVWRKANPSYGISVFPDDLERMARQAMESPSAETNFRTKRLNQWMSSSAAWITSQDWDATTGERPPIEHWAGKPCYIGLDLASVSDFASMAIIFVEDGKLYPYVQHYLPEDTVANATGFIGAKYREWTNAGYITTTEGNITDLSYIEQDVLKAMGTYNVREIAYDAYGATQLSASLIEKGAPMVKFAQGIMSMSDPSKELEKAVKAKNIIHGGDPVLSWMMSNCVLYVDPNDNIKIKKEGEKNKIDGVIALVMALGRLKVNGGLEMDVYRNRGIRTL